MPENTTDALQPVKGVFATQTVATVGFGATKRRIKQTSYIYVEYDGEGGVVCQALNEQFIATGKKRVISRGDLFRKFVPAPDIYLDKFLPAKQALEQAVDTADRCRLGGQLFSAEFEYKNALRMDENHIRASFGLGLTYLEHGDAANASIVFRKLATLKGGLAPEFKHLFNEFGIQLRKNHMYAEAVRHYAKAIQLGSDDENLFCNLARALYEKGNVQAARRFLDKALAARPDFAVARKFKAFIEVKIMETTLDDSVLSTGGPPPSTGSKDPGKSTSFRSREETWGESAPAGPKAENA
jgi:tetratricopeptide (TPR) repeat protein